MFPDGSQASHEATNTQIRDGKYMPVLSQEEKEKRGQTASGELGRTNKIKTKEILTTNTTIYTTAKVPLPQTTIINETER